MDVLKQDSDGMRLCGRKTPGSSTEPRLEQSNCKGAGAVHAGERCSGPQVRPYRVDEERGLDPRGAAETGATGQIACEA